jgi:nucleotide-binding universal stress UspA family protein
MKIMATFDGSKFAESILPLLEQMAGLPGAEFTLFSVAESPQGQLEEPRHRPATAAMPGAPGGGTTFVVEAPAPRYAETKGQAVERTLEGTESYLRGLVASMPVGPSYRVEAQVSGDPAATIIEQALRQQPDVIVMATHGHTGLVHVLFGDCAEQVVRSGVAPVLLVHPHSTRARSRRWDEVRSARR